MTDKSLADQADEIRREVERVKRLPMWEQPAAAFEILESALEFIRTLAERIDQIPNPE